MKSIYIKFILAILIGLGYNTFSQSVKKADKRVTFYQYAIAVPILEKIIEKDKEGKEDAMLMLADCYRLMNNEEKAAELYKKHWWDRYRYNELKDLQIATKMFSLSVIPEDT